MTPDDLRSLAAFHVDAAATSTELADRMLGAVAERFRAKAAQHTRWAEQLQQLAADLENGIRVHSCPSVVQSPSR